MRRTRLEDWICEVEGPQCPATKSRASELFLQQQALSRLGRAFRLPSESLW